MTDLRETAQQFEDMARLFLQQANKFDPYINGFISNMMEVEKYESLARKFHKMADEDEWEHK
jgi:hypothetical protein